MSIIYADSVFLRRPLEANSYLNSLPAVNWLKEHRLMLDTPVTFLVGENGSGKSTLLEAIAVSCGFNAVGGTRNLTFSTRATHSGLGE